jgi:hypothetical protein
MTNLKRIADVLVASWTLANADEPFPIGEGLLDRALKRATEEGNFPEYVRKALRFFAHGAAKKRPLRGSLKRTAAFL